MKNLVRFTSGNALLQIIGLLTGLTVVRGLSVQDYAEYAIYVGLLFGLINLSDAGISGRILSLGVGVVNSSEKMAALIKAGIRARKNVGLYVNLLGLLILATLLHANGAENSTVIASAALMVITLQAVFHRAVWQAYFRADLRAHQAQRVLILGALLRLTILIPLLVWPVLGVIYALSTTAASYWAEALVLGKIARKKLPKLAANSTHFENEILSAVKTVMPMNVANLIRGQMVTGLITLFGSTVVIAEINAISRYALAFAIVNAIILEIISPRIARYQNDKKTVLKWMLLAMAVYASLAILGILIMDSLSPWLLGALGHPYEGLKTEFLVVNIGAALMNMAVALGTLNLSQNWIKGSWVLIPLLGLWVVFGYSMLDLGTTSGAAWLYLLQAAPLWGVELLRLIVGYKSK